MKMCTFRPTKMRMILIEFILTNWKREKKEKKELTYKIQAVRNEEQDYGR